MSKQWTDIDYNPHDFGPALEQAIPLNFMQKEVWSALALSESDDGSLNESMTVHFHEAIDQERLQKAIHAVVSSIP